jgi:hypothetical protein
MGSGEHLLLSFLSSIFIRSDDALAARLLGVTDGNDR